MAHGMEGMGGAAGPDTGIDTGGWGRRRLLAILAAAVTLAVLLLSGFGYAVHLALDSAPSAEDSPGAAGSSSRLRGDDAAQAGAQPEGQARRDAIAAARMLQVSAQAMHPTTPAPVPAPQIRVPAGTGPGPASVLTGFAHTPQGAVGQLAQIETTVLQAMSIRRAHEVYQGWALPGGVGAADWTLTGHVQAFLAGTEMGPQMDVSASVVADPAGGMVKGTDGPDWTVACVLLRVTAVVTTQARIGYGHCERMQWSQGRWMIAPGTPPVRAPSTWPGSVAYLEAGWRDWVSPEPAAVQRNEAGHAHHTPAGTCGAAGGGRR